MAWSLFCSALGMKPRLIRLMAYSQSVMMAAGFVMRATCEAHSSAESSAGYPDPSSRPGDGAICMIRPGLVHLFGPVWRQTTEAEDMVLSGVLPWKQCCSHGVWSFHDPSVKISYWPASRP